MGECIGRGNYGEVHICYRKNNEKPFVIKQIPIQEEQSKDMQNILNEISLLQSLKHPNIVPYYESFNSEGKINIVMKFCEGGDLYKKIRNQNNQKFSEKQIRNWLAKLVLGLHYLHSKKILHRDLKTQNIFLSEDQIFIGDFGISKTLENTRDLANTYIGTPYYMSPELFKYQPYSYKSDIWSLGCILYEMCNLKHAFNAQTINGLAVKILKGNYLPISQSYSKELRDFVRKLLITNPEGRPKIFQIVQFPFVQNLITEYLVQLDTCKELNEYELDSLRWQVQLMGVSSLIGKHQENVFFRGLLL